MSEREYVRALNAEIAKLNEIIDRKIMHEYDYRKEARRHKVLLTQIRRSEARKSMSKLWRHFFPIWG